MAVRLILIVTVNIQGRIGIHGDALARTKSRTLSHSSPIE
jgi:hypothetical protein